MKIKSLILISFLLCFQLLNAQIRVASILGDNMVLQRNAMVNLWGTARPGQKLAIKIGWAKVKLQTKAAQNGKWLVKVKTPAAGGPYAITISSGNEKITLNNVLIGEVWICSGQSNMQMPIEGFRDMPVNHANDYIADANNDQIRLFTVSRAASSEPLDTCAGSWSVATTESVKKFSAIGYLFTKLLQHQLHIPVGIISTDWGGSRIEAWMDYETITQFPYDYAQTKLLKEPNHRASNLYNGMIAPLVNLVFKGVIWYQGEDNINNYKDYPQLMTGMVGNWRKVFNIGEFPFYYVQIAPFAKYPYLKGMYAKKYNSALQRDAQLKAMDMIPNSGMVCTLDIGDKYVIHPPEKYIVAKRLSWWALSQTYGYSGIECKSTVFDKMEVKDTLAILSFKNLGIGLTTYNKRVDCFEVAGTDKVFHPARMAIDKNHVNVWSPDVKRPVAVRYGFSDFPVTHGYLYNDFGLPVPSFRTDNW